MTRTTKRLLSMLIVLAMTLSMLSVISFATGTTTTVYCQAPDSWTGCKVYWWGSADTNPTWPGIDMILGEDGIWYSDIPTDVIGIIFNDGNGTQTSDLMLPAAEPYLYVVSQNSWITDPQPEPVYYVAGTFNDWNPCDPDYEMAEQEDGTYTQVLTLAAGEHQLKITDGSWDNCWPAADSNVTFRTTADGDVTVSFDGTDVTVTGEYLMEPEYWTVYFQPTPSWEACYVYWWGSSLDNPSGWPGYSMTMNEEGLWEYQVPSDCLGLIFSNGNDLQTNDLMPPDYDGYLYQYNSSIQRYVVGTFNGWNPCDPDYEMTLLDDGTYTLTFPVSVGEHQLKITDGSWNNCWPAADSNVTFRTTADGDVTVSFDGTDVTVSGEYLAEEEPAELWTVYFQAPVAWEECYVFWLGSATGQIEWPGSPMSLNEEGLWEGSVPSDCTNVLFNDQYNQTSYLDAPEYDGYLYEYSLGDLYVSGSFNDWAENDPDYKLIPQDDGSQVLTINLPAGFHEYVINTPFSASGIYTNFNTYLEGWVEIYVSYDGSVSTNAEYYGPTAEDISSITLVGNEGLTGADWGWEANEMTQEGNLYSITFTNVPAGDYDYFYAANGSWELFWGVGEAEAGVWAEAYRDTPNYLYVPDPNSTVTFVIDLTNMDPITGNGAQCMVTIEAGEPSLDPDAAYYVAGTVNGWVPNDSEYVMAIQEDGTVSLTFLVTAGDHELKITDGSWNNCWPVDQNYTFSTTADGDVTVTFDGTDVTVTGDYVEAEAPAEYWTVYYEVPESWSDSDIYVYWWGSSLANPEWPGVSMACSTDNIWESEIPSDCLGVVFSNADGDQSGDLPTPEYHGYFYGSSDSDEPLTDPLEIVDAAYNLWEGETLAYSYTLTGEIITVDTPYDETYGNITVTMVVPGRESFPIQCYRLTGDGVADLTIGDTITVEGYLTNYYGTVEFTQGCLLLDVVKGDGTPIPTDPLEIVDAAYGLGVDEVLPYGSTLTGVITSVDEPYSDMYYNITVTMVVAGREDKPIVCYRLKGDEVELLKVGDTITVTGTLQNYNGTVEFGNACRLVELIPSLEEPEIPEDPAEIIADAYALEVGATLPYPATLTGVITGIDTPYSYDYCNISFTIAVPGCEDMPIFCYRVKGDLAQILMEGDTVTVTGTIKNYNGTIEFTQNSTVTTIGSILSGTFQCATEDEESGASLDIYREGMLAASFYIPSESTTYLMDNLPAGTYTIVVSKEKHVTRTYEVTLGDEYVTQDVKINLIGDVTGDGKVNVGDVSRIYAAAKKVETLDEYAYLCADVTGDGSVNVGDCSRVYGHSKKVNPLW